MAYVFVIEPRRSDYHVGGRGPDLASGLWAGCNFFDKLPIKIVAHYNLLCHYFYWCPGGESNSHALRQSILSRSRLPIPPPGLFSIRSERHGVGSATISPGDPAVAGSFRSPRVPAPPMAGLGPQSSKARRGIEPLHSGFADRRVTTSPPCPT